MNKLANQNSFKLLAIIFLCLLLLSFPVHASLTDGGNHYFLLGLLIDAVLAAAILFTFAPVFILIGVVSFTPIVFTGTTPDSGIQRRAPPANLLFY